MHACPPQPGADRHFAAGFQHPRRGAETLFVKLRISHAPSIFPDVVNTVPRLFALLDVDVQRFNQRFPTTLIEFVITPIHPWLPWPAVSVDRWGNLAEVLLGRRAVENRCGWREEFRRRVPDPNRTIAPNHRTGSFGETPTGGFAPCARRELR